MARGPIRNAVLLAGPTATGKSGAALARAEREGRTLVNADSMQVYDGLRILTARPDEDMLARAPHRLYGHVAPSQPYSVGAWADEVRSLHESGAFDGRPPIFVGGTGLYFRALERGLSPMPDVPPALRASLRAELEADGPERLHAALRDRDPEAASALRPSDGQRVVRALEVVETSGRSILWWQAQRSEPLVDLATVELVVVAADRRDLAERIEARFDQMLDAGALEEARAVTRLGIPPTFPAAKTIGLRELAGVAAGERTLDDARLAAVAATRAYAKRQETWFRHQMGADWRRLAMARLAGFF